VRHGPGHLRCLDGHKRSYAAEMRVALPGKGESPRRTAVCTLGWLYGRIQPARRISAAGVKVSVNARWEADVQLGAVSLFRNRHRIGTARNSVYASLCTILWMLVWLTFSLAAIVLVDMPPAAISKMLWRSKTRRFLPR
jgi:hypothetical protein